MNLPPTAAIAIFAAALLRRRLFMRPALLRRGVLVLLLLGGPSLWPLAPRIAAASERRTQLELALRRDPTPERRLRAAAALGELGDTEALPTLIVSLLGDREASVRAACADALAVLADPAARSALRAATRDEQQVVRRQASAALSKLSGQNPPEPGRNSASGPPLKGRVNIVVGQTGSKAKSGTMPDIPLRLREAVIREARTAAELNVIEESRGVSDTKNGYSVDSSVTKLTRRTTPAGELEISCDVSMIIAVLPAHSVVGMISGGASVIGGRGPSTRPTKAYIESLESEALSQAVRETQASLMNFLRNQARGRQ